MKMKQIEIRPIRTKSDYKAALKIVSALVDADPKRGTPDGDRLEVLGILVEAYEAQHYPIALPDPIEAIKFRMEQQGNKTKIIINTDKLDENTSNEDIILLSDELAIYIKSHFLKNKPQLKNCGCK